MDSKVIAELLLSIKEQGLISEQEYLLALSSLREEEVKHDTSNNTHTC